MGLLGNGFRYNLTGRITTATSMIDGANPSCLPASYNLTAMRRNQLAGAADFDSRASIPDGCRHPVAWLMPQVAGGLSARNTITGSGNATGTVQSGYNIAATLTGAGGVDSASTFLGLIVSLSATLTASGGISTASANALATMVATLTGSGSVSATAAGLADLGATLTGAGSITATNTALMDITATIRGYGDLTPEGIRDTVWNAVLTNYPISGSAGNTLALAGSGGVDYNALATAVWAYTTRTLTSGTPPTEAQIAEAVMTYAVEAGWTTEELLRVFAAVLAGKVSGAGTGTEVFRGINDDKNRITATTDSNGNRSNITLDAS
jgi:hypothetical protein